MATPTGLVWDCALHLLQYSLQNKAHGIKFSETDEGPVAFVEASNKDDPEDGRAQYGYFIHGGGSSHYKV